MELLEAMQARHSVRRYTDEKIGTDVADALRAELDAINAESGLHFALFTDEETGFAGKLHNVKNYIVFAGSGKNLDERIGYYGARAMLKAQMLGLNSCWVALSFNKGAVEKLMTLASGEKIVNALAVGYGETQGNPHKNKPIEKPLCSRRDDVWQRVEQALPDVRHRNRTLHYRRSDRRSGCGTGGI